MKDVVVGVDRSDTARTAAHRAATLATAYRANLHVVMCVERINTVDVAVSGERFHTDSLAEADQYLHDLTRDLGHQPITTTVGLGDPAKTLCAEALRLDARTIVVGNRRVQGLTRVLGSIAADVAKHARCDVLIANTCDPATQPDT